MVVPSRLADTVTPSSFWPEAEVIDPASNWSAAWAVVAIVRLAALASRILRIFIISLLVGFGSMIRVAGADRRRLAAATRACGCRAGNRDGPHIGNDVVDLVGLEIELERGHARGAVHDVFAHDLVVAAAGALVERRSVGLCIEGGRQVAHATGLGQKLAAMPLLLVEIFLGRGGHRSSQKQREHRRSA